MCSIEDAFNCFMGTNLDVLVIENFILYKKDQDQKLINDYKNKFELDKMKNFIIHFYLYLIIFL